VFFLFEQTAEEKLAIFFELYTEQQQEQFWELLMKGQFYPARWSYGEIFRSSDYFSFAGARQMLENAMNALDVNNISQAVSALRSHQYKIAATNKIKQV
jgi:hypothetical protein